MIACNHCFLLLFLKSHPTELWLESIPVAFVADSHSDQDRDRLHVARPAALDHRAVEIEITVVAFQRAISPSLELVIDLVVQPAHFARGDVNTAQFARDVADFSGRNALQIHLDQGFLERAFHPPVAVDDLTLEGDRPEPGNGQLRLADPGGQLALAGTVAVVLAHVCPFIGGA